VGYNPLGDLRSRLTELPELGVGDRRHEVKLLRRVLSCHGHGNPLWRDAANEVGDLYDDGLRLIVSDYQYEQGIAPSGFVDAATWQALAALADGPEALGLQVVARALQDVGWREAGRNNRGDLAETAIREAGLTPPQPYCCAILGYWIKRALGAVPFPVGASCSRLVARAKLAGRIVDDLAQVRPGDAWVKRVLQRGAETYPHAGLVERVDGSTVCTVEGNTNGSGSSDGDGVYCKRRKISALPDGQPNCVFVRLV